MMSLPDTHKAALRWLLDHGCEGAIDRYGRVVAQGDRYKSPETAQVWLRLALQGYVGGAGPNRIRLMPDGKTLAEKLPRPSGDEGPFRASAPRRPYMQDDDPEDFR